MAKTKGGGGPPAACTSGCPVVVPKAAVVKNPPPQRSRAAPKESQPPVEIPKAVVEAPPGRAVLAGGEKRRAGCLDAEEVAAVAQCSRETAQSVVDAIFQLALARLQQSKPVEIPKLVSLRVRKVKGRPATTKTLFGKEYTLKERPDSKRVLAMPTDALNAALFR